jgi:hypothetical protein
LGSCKGFFNENDVLASQTNAEKRKRTVDKYIAGEKWGPLLEAHKEIILREAHTSRRNTFFPRAAT